MTGGEHDLTNLQLRPHVTDALARSAKIAAEVAGTEERRAAALEQMAEQRPHQSAILRARSHAAREQAARLRLLAAKYLGREAGPPP